MPGPCGMVTDIIMMMTRGGWGERLDKENRSDRMEMDLLFALPYNVYGKCFSPLSPRTGGGGFLFLNIVVHL